MGYRPRVVLGSFTIKWFPKKYAGHFKSNNKSKVKHAMSFLEQQRFENESIAVNDKNQWVTEDMRDQHIRRLFNRYNIKYSPDNIYLLRDVEVIIESKANYKV